jgi:stage II sporulation protein M
MKKLYKHEWSFFKENLVIKFGWILVLSFFFGELFYFSFLHNPEIMKKIMDSVVERFQKEGLTDLQRQSSLWLALKIFYVNLRSTFLFTLLGFIPFLVGTVLFFGMFPLLLGVTLASLITKGFDFFTFFKFTAPHGVFELTAVFYGVSLGAYLSLEITKKLFSRYRQKTLPFWELTKPVFKSYPLIIIPLLALAALVEAFITPLLK